MNRLRLMAMFVEVVQCGSISAAADKLDLSKSVISTALKQLEQDLGISLLKRTTRRQALTTAGERFYQQSTAMVQLADSAWLEASHAHQRPNGRLVVTAPHALMRTLVIPALTKTFIAYPEVELHFVSDDQYVGLSQQNIDLAVRVGESADSSLKQRKIGEFKDVLCVGAAAQFDELLAAPYIAQQWQKGKSVSHQWLNGSEWQEVEFQIKHRANSVFDVASLIETGLGIGLLPEFLLKASVEIQALSHSAIDKVNSVYLLHPYQNHLPVSVKMAMEAIKQQMAHLVVKY